MNVPFYTSTREYELKKSEFDGAVQKVMSKGDFILGHDVKALEEECKLYTGSKYCVGVASGSDALVIGADILGLRDGAEVLTPTFTFFASSSCIARLGAKPIFVDMDEHTFNMDIKKAEQLVTKSTRGIVPVHLFLQPTDMQSVTKLAKTHNLKVLEDAAEAFGMSATIDGQKKHAGTIGDIGVFSFFPTKTLGAYGDAGMMLTEDEDLYKKILSYRVHGCSVKYQHDYIGYNSRLDTIQAAILRIKLKSIDKSISARKHHANHYIERLSAIPELKFPKILTGNDAVWYLFSILTQNRDGLTEYLKERDIGYSIYYPKPLHLQKCFSYLGYKRGDFPIAERVSEQILALPLFPELTDDEVDYVCDTILAFYNKKNKI